MARTMESQSGGLSNRPRRTLSGRVLLDAFAEAILLIATFIFGFFWWTIRWSLATLFFVGVMAAAGYWVFSEAVSGGAYVNVPNVANLPLSEAKAIIEGAGLDVGQERAVVNDEWPPYTVIGQRPQPGNVVREGRPVNLTISKEEEFGVAPDYTGQLLTAVTEKIEASEFEIGAIARIPHSAPQNTVIAQDPAPMGIRANTNRIFLLVSDGAGLGGFAMPDLRNMPLADALTRLSALPVNTTPIEVTDETQPAGVVLSQEPVPGTELAQGAQIIIRYRKAADAATPVPSSEYREVVVAYQLPHSWFDREVRIDVTGSDGVRKTVYPTPNDFVNGVAPKHEAGTTINQPILYRDSMTVEVFLDDRLARIYRYGHQGDPQVEDVGAFSGTSPGV